tara:strand:+ start:4455 stop:5555 length:1101 start_codon:yes stop_codon:yes gene_type:complete
MINDYRLKSDFKNCTFSGYKKIDVMNALFKCLDSKNIESSCNWLIECILSGYTPEIWERLCIYYCTNVHINNINLLEHTYNTNIKINKLIHKKNYIEILNLRNNQTCYNLLISYILLLITTPLNIKYTNNIKIKKEDFNLHNLQLKLQANMNILPDNIVNINEPPEIKLIINEIYYHLESSLNSRDKVIYWINWILEWEKINIKNKINWDINSRHVNVLEKYKKDIIWIIWETINIISNKKSKFIKKNINTLYSMYIINYDKNKRNKRLPYLFLCVSILSCNVKKKELINNLSSLIQAQCNYHMIIQSKKIHEKNNILNIENNIQELNKKSYKKNKKEEQNEKTEKIKDKLSDFNELDKILFFSSK